MAVALCGLLNVSALLAWVYGLGAFHLWFLAAGVPSLAVLVGAGWWTGRRPDTYPYVRRALVSGALGGLLGTIGYDLFRIPFVISGMRLFAPIDSYGVLLLDAAASSSTTGVAGWSYHFANGIGFGLAYAALALGRRWPWAVLWAMVLETATILTPFFEAYGLRGQWGVIAVAYAAHIAYGVPLGLVVQRAATWEPRRPLLVPVSAVLATLAVSLLGWLRPTGEVPSEPIARVRDGRFAPEWLRVAPGDCVKIAGDPQRERCFEREGAHRVRITSDPYSGGFVLVDAQAG